MDNNLRKFLDNNQNSDGVVVIQGLGFVGAVMSLICANSIKKNYTVIGVDLPNSNGKRI